MDELKTVEEEQKRDHALYFVEDGEPGFSPEHNKFVIENTIKKTEAMKKRKKKEYEEALGERSDAVVTYLRSRFAEGSTPIEKYFGKQWMAKLRGEKIAQVLQQSRIINGQKRKLYLPGD